MRSSSRLPVLIVASVLLGGCAQSLGPGTSGASASTSSTPLPSVAAPTPSSTPLPSVAPPTPSSIPSATASDDAASFVGGAVTTLADDGLRVRSQPRVGDDSQMLDPLLPIGSALLILQGPVSASGYDWYEVVPLTSRELPSGWVASASREGEPWIEVAEFACPSLPTDFRSLASQPRGVGLACFPRVPITVETRIISCNCDADGSWYTPGWFFLGSGSPDLLVAPDVTTVPPDFADWFALNLDPAGEHPDLLPIGEVVEITGIFDHPAASSCTRTQMDGEPVSSQGCRLEFAVTRLVAAGR